MKEKIRLIRCILIPKKKKKTMAPPEGPDSPAVNGDKVFKPLEERPNKKARTTEDEKRVCSCCVAGFFFGFRSIFKKYYVPFQGNFLETIIF